MEPKRDFFIVQGDYNAPCKPGKGVADCCFKASYSKKHFSIKDLCSVAKGEFSMAQKVSFPW